MRPLNSLRAAGGLTAAAALLAAGATAAEPTTAEGQSPAVSIAVKDSHLRYGERLIVSARTARSDAGRPAALESRTSSGWRTLQTAKVGRDGRMRFVTRLARSGSIRVTLGAPTAARTAIPAARPAAVSSSRSRGVSVSARLSTAARRLDVLAGRRGAIRGAVSPARRGRVVRLERYSRGAWRTIARARTATSGRFGITTRRLSLGSAKLRLRFRGDSVNAGTARGAGRLNVYRPTRASWYGPGLYGNHVACGGRLQPSTMGVANRSLPCGTMVTLRYRGRSVRVPVIDRGPYAAGRTWDLTRATKRALGFGDIGTVYSTA